MNLRIAAVAAALFAAATAGAQDSRPDAPRFVFVGLHGGVFEKLASFAGPAGVRVEAVSDDVIARGGADVSTAAAVVIQHLRTESKDALKSALKAAWSRNPALRVITIANAGADWFKPEDGVRGIERDPELTRYYQASTLENMRRLLVYLSAKYGGGKAAIEPVAPPIAVGLWHPDHDGFFEDEPSFAAWSRARFPEARPRVAVCVHSLHLLFQQPAVVEALVRALEARGLAAAAIIDTGEGLQGQREKYESLLLAFGPKLVVHTCHSTDTVAFRQKLGVPHVHSVFFSRKSIDAWKESLTGLEGRDWMFQAVTQEVLGAIEPIVCAGTQSGNGGGEPLQPIPERVERLANRAAKWVRLASAAPAEKRAAIVYYDREMGKNELMRGSTTGMFLNGPRSLVNVLGRMAKDGWRLTATPKSEDEVLGWMLARGRQIGMWAPEELDRLVREGDPVLVPVATYEKWFEKRVPEARRRDVISKWGPAPGAFMTWTDRAGAKSIVIPRIDLGNVVLLPQPLRGEAQDPKLLHDRSVPPPHNYLATYFWLEEGWHADVMVHFGTHGSEFLFPGKTIGTNGDDWGEILAGSLPNVDPWIVSNLGEAPAAKRRSSAVIVSHQTPPVVSGELADDLLNLHEDVEKLLGLEAGALKEKFRKSVTEQVRRQNLVADLKLGAAAGRDLNDDEVRAVDEYLHELRESKTPISLHVLGEPPPEDLLVPYVTSCLRRKYLDAVAAVFPRDPRAHESGGGSEGARKKAEEIVGLVIRRGLEPAEALVAAGAHLAEGAVPKTLADSLALARDLASRFARAGEELDGLMAALGGRFVEPGPGASPVRNPASAPGGRNLYQVNPEELPSRPSFELAKKLVDAMIADHVKQHGHAPEKVACSLNAGASYADYGVMEGEVFWLLGVEPVWDEKNLVQDVKIVPRAMLGRPRVDVFLASPGTYRDVLPTRMALVDKAIRAVAALDEPDNPVRNASRRIEAALVARGIAADKAAKLATARMFGHAPGGYGNAGYYYMIERSGTWESRDDLVKAYLANAQYAYADGVDGELAPEAYEEAMRGTEIVMRNWTDPVRSPLSDKYMWFQGGSLALAVKYVTGKEPEFRISDVRDPDASRTVRAEDALMADFRVKLFNRKWIEGMKKEGYAGADQVSTMVDNAMGWEIMREGSVRADVWDEIKKVFVDDKYDLRVREWFEAENPFAFQELTEVLLEAVRKGFWNADEATVKAIAEAYADSVRRHGEGQGLRGGGNEKLAEFVKKRLGAPGEVAGAGANGAPVPVSGPKLEPASRPAAAAPPRGAAPTAPADERSPVDPLAWVGLGCLGLFFLGFLLGRR